VCSYWLLLWIIAFIFEKSLELEAGELKVQLLSAILVLHDFPFIPFSGWSMLKALSAGSNEK
jgi:hypothetical protein